ncbi:MAG TPA: TonB-dependent receptor [Candidatus Sulfotelmatobacter sp.]|nr:TonB-dependent receptor [Candidatus Sulfotelmatobacter sp.]
MPGRLKARGFRWAVATVFLIASTAFAQFTASIQGVVQDQSGAGVGKATIQLRNTATGVTVVTTSDASGDYRFVSLAPGSYKVTAEAAGFSKSEVDVTLLTEQNLNVPIAIKVGSISEAITVTTEVPVVDTADSRTQLTLENQAVAQLPVAGRNLVTLVTMAPGVSGLGTSAGGGTPGSGPDNFSTETAVDVTANGQGGNNNQYVVDGLDVTSGIRQGVLNLTPTPDSIQETSVQVNTFSPEHSRAAGLVTAFTTRSGTDQFHGSASDYFTYQGFFANQHFAGLPYKPFHSNDPSFAIGGPVIPHRLFFYFAVEPRRGSNGAGGSITFADPAFLSFISNPANGLSNTVGTHVLTTYVPVGLSGVTSITAQDFFGTGASGCNTAATAFIPCATPFQDTGSYGTTAIRNGTQYFARLDTNFTNDRVYASLYRTLLTSGAPTASPQFSSLNPTWEVAGQLTWTHTFSPTTVNDASAGVSRVEGNLATGAKDYTVPNINVGGGFNQQLGAGFAQGDFIQHNYHWRDVLTHISGAHTLKAGYEGWYGDDVENFQGPWSTPAFGFDNILKLAEDSPNNENGVFYNPVTGTPQLASWNAASRTFGLFVEDTWKARKNLTVTLGLRYDDQGNPWSKSPTTVFGNFYLGTGTTQQEQIANGYAKATHNALLHAVNGLLSPRVGFAWDPTSKGDWVVRGGAGLYNNWLTNANVQEEFRGNPPGLVAPNFSATGSANAEPANFQLGSGSKPPFGFDTTAPLILTPGLNAQGGQIGVNDGISGINPLLKSPQAIIWSLTAERKVFTRFAASVGYSGSHAYDLASAGNNTNNVSYGVDVNVLNNSYMLNNSSPAQGSVVRLNPSFGSITYTANDRISNYNGIFFDFKGRFSRGFLDASYTHSRSQDDANNYPTPFNPRQYYGPSAWDVPNRISITFNYSLKGLNDGKGAVGLLTGGWGISGTSVFQSGEPFTVATGNGYQPVCASTATACPSAGNPAIGYAPSSGDYNGDGVNNDYPDAANYHQGTSRRAFLTGIFSPGQFSAPSTLGAEGNQKVGQFREPNFAETDVNFYKDTRITERVNLQLRFEFFNIFNRANLLNIDGGTLGGVRTGNWTDANFGQATASHLPRWWQIGARVSF